MWCCLALCLTTLCCSVHVAAQTSDTGTAAQMHSADLQLFDELAQTGPPGSAQPPGAQQASSPCAAPQGTKKTLADHFKCLKHIYDKVTAKQGFHLVQGGVAPGSGLTGGIGYSKGKRYEAWRTQFDSSARVSIKKYWEFDANLRLTKNDNSISSNDSGGPAGSLKINLYGQVKDMPRLDYFGIGPETNDFNRTVYHYRQGVIGADISKPVRRWLNLGGAFEHIWTDLVTISNPTVNSVERNYTEATAPGLFTQPNYLHYALFAGVHSKAQPEARRIDYKFYYHFYQDYQEHRYSFRRFDADLKHKIPLGEKNELRIRGRLSFSETKDGQRVPFYLMETLGGSNIRGDDTLRGFRDYRFRDRDLILLQTEYLRQLYGPLNLIAFYDVGKVAPSISRFDEGRLRQTYGLGIVIVPRQTDNVLFRFYVALGSGEGSHTYVGVGDALGGRADRLIR